MAVFLCEESAKNPLARELGWAEKIKETIDLKYFRGKSNETIFIPMTDGTCVLLCGLGSEKKITGETIRNASSGAVSIFREKGIKTAGIRILEAGDITQKDAALLAVEGLYLSNYVFDRYKAKLKEGNSMPLDRAVIISDSDLSDELNTISIISENTNLCRDIINETSDNCNSETMSALAKKISKTAGISCTIYGRKEIERMKMGLLLAVNRGSKRDPQLAVMKYSGNPGSGKSIAIIGKGITFDSGGMNLKPSGHIENMRSDMSGAAAVIYTLKSAAELKLKKNVYGIIPLTDNMISNDSYRPGDIFRSYSGKTVEIGNTDAEGRLILADALSFTEEKLKPDIMIDIATLTGACIIALGETVAGYLTGDEGLAGLLEAASAESGDRVWRLPIVDEYEENMKSDIADINNVSSEKNAGTIMGAIFLKNFVKSSRWAHIDIAGTSWYSKPRGYRPKNATGFGVRLLTAAIKNWNEKD